MIDVLVDTAVDIADAVRQVELRAADGTPLPAFGAGDHIEVHLESDLRRCYSLVGQPGAATDTYRLAVALDPASRGGSKAVHALRTGQALTISAPRSGFPLAPGPVPAVLIAGGIGITPILTMAYALNGEDRPWQLHYAFRSQAAAALLPELSTLAAPRPERLRLYPDEPTGRPSIDISALVTGRARMLSFSFPDLLSFSTPSTRSPLTSIRQGCMSSASPARPPSYQAATR